MGCMQRPGLFLIDSYGFIFRAYHARARSGAPPMRTKTGLSTEAVYIFHNMVRKLLTAFQPKHIAAVFESEGPTLREQGFAEYKANRKAMPEDLAEQIPYIRKILDAMRIPVLEYPGYEADDVIGTIARSCAGEATDVVIVSSDKDMLQLVGDHIAMLDPRKDDLWYDTTKVIDYMGVPPDGVVDLLALKGDAIDNIPGAPGIGDKGARDLVNQYGSAESVIEHAADVKRKTYRESLQSHRDQILLSKELATIQTDVPIQWELEDFTAAEPDLDSLRKLYCELEFYSLLAEIGDIGPAVSRERHYGRLEESTDVEAYVARCTDAGRVGIAFAKTGEGELMERRIGLAPQVGEAREIPGEFFDLVRPLIENPEVRKAALDWKFLLRQFRAAGLRPQGFVDDPVLYNFLLTADPSASTTDAVIARRLRTKAEGGVDQLADFALELGNSLAAEVEERGLTSVYETIDLPLAPVLARMEDNGVRIDAGELDRLSVRMDERLAALAAQIHELAGHPFNINSPQQLAKVLFDEMGLPAPPRSGKKKGLSTAADVLEVLSPEYRVAQLVLDYRQVGKLKGTYVDALPLLISPEDGRLHTTFNPAGAATGRLSSANPNLQNIPIRSDLGREIRAAFVPRSGWKLIVADYSQIELRLLAHMSRDPVLVTAFQCGEDIHTRTAAEVFGVPPIAVTPELRRRAKAVNFGIVYGLSAFGLANQLGIPRTEAELYIKSYFERYQGVRIFIDRTIEEVRRKGLTTTLFGRQRPIPDIKSRNPNARGFAERTAVNTPLQGTAADLIKLAMIRIHREIESRGLRTEMLLQVHDELIFEAPESESAGIAGLVKDTMESVDELEVPLIVDIGIGDNWRDAK